MPSPYREEIVTENGQTIRKRYRRERLVQIHVSVSGLWLTPLELLKRRPHV